MSNRIKTGLLSDSLFYYTMKKKILIHSIVFSPDGVSTAYLYNDIARRFKKEGYDVAVLTTTPHYNVVEEALDKQQLKRHWTGTYYTSEFEGIPVKHVYQKKYKSTFLRLLGFIYWHIVSFILGLGEKNVDIIISPSPPLTIGWINIMLGKLKRCKVIYNVQEIYPDFLIEQGSLKSKSVISFLKRLERYVYNNSAAVTTIDQVFKNTIEGRFKNPDKLHIIPNFVDTELYRPISKDEISLDKSLFPDDDYKKIMYAGNIGHAQDWEPLIELAKKLSGEKVRFIVIGEGVLKEQLINDVEKYNLSNIVVLPYQRRELMPHLLAYADMQFIFMSKDMQGHGFPSKVYTIMAAAKPLIVASGKNTPIYNFLDGVNCALLVDNIPLNDKVEQMASFIINTTDEELRQMGQNGYEVIQQNYTSEIVSKRYVEVADGVLKRNPN